MFIKTLLGKLLDRGGNGITGFIRATFKDELLTLSSLLLNSCESWKHDGRTGILKDNIKVWLNQIQNMPHFNLLEVEFIFSIYEVGSILMKQYINQISKLAILT